MPPPLQKSAGGRSPSHVGRRSPGPCQEFIRREHHVPEQVDHLDQVGEIVRELRSLGLAPVLVGGMALVVLGSRRVTRDFDFVIPHPGDRLGATVDLFYDRGFELISRVNAAGDVLSTIDNRKVAAVRLRIDAPASAYFFNVKSGLRIDLLFDFPIPAAKLGEHAKRIKIRAQLLTIASVHDLLRLKRIARAARSAPGDTEDIAFLEARRKRRR